MLMPRAPGNATKGNSFLQCPLTLIHVLRYIHRQPATLFFLVVDMYFLAALLIEIVYVTLVSTAHGT